MGTPPRLPLFVICAWTLSACGLASFADAPKVPRPAQFPPQRVDEMVRKTIDYLYAKQSAKGHWEKADRPEVWDRMTGAFKDMDGHIYGVNYGGTTALVLYALQSAGESYKDPRITKGLDWLKDVPMYGVYAAAMRLNAFQFLPLEDPKFKDYKRVVNQDQQFLVGAMIRQGPGHTAAGLYNYTARIGGGNRFDHSVSQFGVLGAWAAATAGYDPGVDYWKPVEAAWVRDQSYEGGWTYERTPDSSHTASGAMTAAGCATLFITQDFLRRSDYPKCEGNVTNEALEKGMLWLEKNFSATANPGGAGAGSLFYWLYASERVGVASGYKFYGDHDWFNEGAWSLSANQAADGSFGGTMYDTSFGLLFFARGRQPVLMNKLKYPGRWNERPRDAANVTHWFAQQYKRDFNWQIIPIDADADDYADAPVLYMPGNVPPGEGLAFTADQKEKLRRYVESGGMILCVADCQNVRYASFFKSLTESLFPYSTRVLPESHPLFADNLKLKKPVTVLAQSNGVRELCVLVPGSDPGRAWQGNRAKEEPEMFAFAADVFFYATGGAQLRYKGNSWLVRKDAKQQPTRTLKIARVIAGPNPDPEPGGWLRMTNLLHNNDQVQLIVEPVQLAHAAIVTPAAATTAPAGAAAAPGKLTDYKLAHFTGTRKFTFTPEQANDMKTFLIKGGLLVADAAGGSTEFAESAEAELLKLIPGAKFEPVPPGDPLLGGLKPAPELREQTDTTGGEKMGSVTATSMATTAAAPAASGAEEVPGLKIAYRKFAQTRLGNTNALRLKGIRLGKRWLVIYSAEDLSGGLVGQDVDGITGYTPNVASELMRRILINSMPKPAEAAGK